MYTPRKLGAPGARRDSNYPLSTSAAGPWVGTPPGSPSLSPGGSSSRARSTRRRLGIPFVRTRIHPLFLIPVFLVGAYFSPFKASNDLVYSGPAYRDDYGGGAFLPPDAPPLVPVEEDELGFKRAKAKGRVAVKEPKGAKSPNQQEQEEDQGELWDFNYQPEDDGEGTATPHLVERDGYLYYPTSSIPLVDMVIPPAKRLAAINAEPAAARPKPGSPLEANSKDLVALPPAPPPWYPPGAHYNPYLSPASFDAPLGPPATRELNARLAAQAARAQAAVNPPAGGGGGGGRAGLGAGRAKPGQGNRAAGVELGPNGQRLGPNAAAMIRALRMNQPFRPKKPTELLREAKRREEEKRKKKEEEDKKNGWEPVKAQGRFAVDRGAARKEAQAARAAKKEAQLAAAAGGEGAGAAVVPPARAAPGLRAPPAARPPPAAPIAPIPARVADDHDDDEGEDEISLDATEDEDELSAEDQEIIDALMALTPAERAELSPEELELIREVEAELAEAGGALAPANDEEEDAAEPDADTDAGGGVEAEEQDVKPAGRARIPPGARPRAKPAFVAKPVYRGKLPDPPQPARKKKTKKKKQQQQPGAQLRGPNAAPPGPDKKKPLPVRPLQKRAFIPEPPSEDPPSPRPPSPVDDSARVLLPRAMPNSDAATMTSSPPASRDRLHPIAKLIADAEEKWEDMLRRQSQTLEHAVFEYQRRYGRKPPLGFDKWWRYAMENRVILVDEYDQINEDIEPFFALSSAEIRARATALAEDDTLPHFARSFSLAIKDGAIHASGPGAKSEKAEDMQDIMGEFAEVLPDMTLTFASHNEPSVAISGESRERHLKAARENKILSAQESLEVLENPGYTPFHGLCMPNSTARRHADGRPLDARPSGASFVSLDHTPAMDLCTHPEIQHQHGFTAWGGPRPYLLYPLFSSSKTKMHGDLLCAPFDEYFAEVGRDPVWERKKHNKVMWRGSSNGVYHEMSSGWRSTHRARLVHLANDVEGTREVRFADKADDSLRRFIGPTNAINEHYFDIAYAGSPMQCETDDGTCEIMQKELRFVPSMSKDAGNEYKYVLDVDGNGWSDRFHRLMSSSALVFKSTIFPEWWTRRIVPWYHYVPIKSDYSDLTDAAAFFIGAPDGTGSHDNLAKKLALNGKKWAQEHWRETDMAAYQLRLYLEFSRLLNRDEQGSHDFTLN